MKPPRPAATNIYSPRACRQRTAPACPGRHCANSSRGRVSPERFAVERLAARPVDQLAPVLVDVHPVEVRIGVAVQVGADHRLRLVPFGDPGRLEAALHAGPGVQADEVHEVRPVQQQLRHDRIVVVRLADVAVGAGLRLGPADGVREVRREGLAREAGGGDRRLLDVDPLAIDVGRGQDERRGRADRRDDIVLGRLVTAELEHVVARDLRIVGREVARLLALIMVDRGAVVRLDRQVAAGAARRPADRWQVKQAISLSGWASSFCGTPAPNR